MNSWLELGKKQADLFTSNNIAYMELLVTGDCNRSILNTCYNILIRTKKIKPIEDWEVGDKRNVWETAKETAKDRMDNEGLIELSKALITLEYFLQ